MASGMTHLGMMQNPISEKPTLVQLLNRHRVNTIRLARVAGLSRHTVRVMALRIPVQPIVAQAVLHGLFLITGVFYRLEDVDIALIPPSYVVGNIYVEREDLELHTIMANERRG